MRRRPVPARRPAGATSRPGCPPPPRCSTGCRPGASPIRGAFARRSAPPRAGRGSPLHPNWRGRWSGSGCRPSACSPPACSCTATCAGRRSPPATTGWDRARYRRTACPALRPACARPGPGSWRPGLASAPRSAAAKVGSSRASTWPAWTASPSCTSIERTIEVSIGCTTKVGSRETTLACAVTTWSTLMMAIAATQATNMLVTSQAVCWALRGTGVVDDRRGRRLELQDHRQRRVAPLATTSVRQSPWTRVGAIAA